MNLSVKSYVHSTKCEIKEQRAVGCANINYGLLTGRIKSYARSILNIPELIFSCCPQLDASIFALFLVFSLWSYKRVS